jgi:5-methylcytosine-specific restriction protein A
MDNRRKIYDSLLRKMIRVGFVFEKEQPGYFQNRELEFKFIHPQLMDKFKSDSLSTRATKFYLKALTDDPLSEIGLVSGKSSPLYTSNLFADSNAIDTFDDTPAWTNRTDDNSLDRLLRSIGDYLDINIGSSNDSNTYLFTWNPNKWEWEDLNENIHQLNTLGYFERRWSCGNSKKIKKGDRVFLIRLGREPKGIMGSGYAKCSFYSGPHWDGTHDKYANYIDIDFDVLINPDKNLLFSEDHLNKIDAKKLQQWFPQQSGISINSEILESLESDWFSFISEHNYVKHDINSGSLHDTPEEFFEGKVKNIVQTTYERNPHARKVCLENHGYNCKVCDFNFEYHFGKMGKGFIHVHHIKPISEIAKEYKINPLEDLVPLCPNCHAMIHSRKPALDVEELKNIISNNLPDSRN